MNYYSNDKTIQILLALLKAHKIRKAVVSPGTTNMCFVASMQSDPYFEMYSCVDERSAAYMACGLSQESGEPVMLSCTEATASRNYYPALTEAYYKKLPILAITGFHNIDTVGHLQSQVIDRSLQPKDTVRMSVTLRTCNDANDEWANIVNANKAILALSHNGGGPVHINLQYPKDRGLDTKDLPEVRVIHRITAESDFPEISRGKISIFIGSHRKFTQEEEQCIDKFCASNNAVVFCDSTSGYKGKYRMNLDIVFSQKAYKGSIANTDLLIHLGEVSGDLYAQKLLKNTKNVWRISEDGEVRDTFKKLSFVFQMKDFTFFSHYLSSRDNNTYYQECLQEKLKFENSLPDLPFSNEWIAQNLCKDIPEGSAVHLGIFNSLRSWNMNDISNLVDTYCNVGGFGIDGTLSTCIGAALATPQKMHFCVCGDLAFFYDLNSLCNRHVGKNIRILVVNNGRGVEFRNYSHPAYQYGDYADSYIAAGGHNGNKSPQLIKGFVEALGFKYLTASSKEEFLKVKEEFTNSSYIEKPIVFEIFTETNDESESLRSIITASGEGTSVKDIARKIVGKEGKMIIKLILGK